MYQKYQPKLTKTPEVMEPIMIIAVIHSYFIQLKASVSMMYSGFETSVPIMFIYLFYFK